MARLTICELPGLVQERRIGRAAIVLHPRQHLVEQAEQRREPAERVEHGVVERELVAQRLLARLPLLDLLAGQLLLRLLLLISSGSPQATAVLL